MEQESTRSGHRISADIVIVGDGLAVLVEPHPFVKGIADAMRNTAEDLSVDDLRVNDAAAIMRARSLPVTHSLRIASAFTRI